MRYIIYFIGGFILWLLLTWSTNIDHLVAGAVVVLVGTVMFGGYFTERPMKFLQLHRIVLFVLFVPIFVWYMVKANIDVAYRALHPERPIKPGIVKIRTSLKTDIARVFLANSITLTPGTMTCEIDGDIFYIHWIWVQTEDIEEASRIIASRFEVFLRRIFE